MNPWSLITKGLISPYNIFRNYYYPWDIIIDYGEKIINISLEDINLLVEVNQENLTIEAGEEKIDVIFNQEDVTIKN